MKSSKEDPQNIKWFAAIDGKSHGPMPFSKLSQLAAEGKLTPETLVWRRGMSSWQKAGDVTAVAGLFETPPPLPPEAAEAEAPEESETRAPEEERLAREPEMPKDMGERQTGQAADTETPADTEPRPLLRGLRPAHAEPKASGQSMFWAGSAVALLAALAVAAWFLLKPSSDEHFVMDNGPGNGVTSQTATLASNGKPWPTASPYPSATPTPEIEKPRHKRALAETQTVAEVTPKATPHHRKPEPTATPKPTETPAPQPTDTPTPKPRPAKTPRPTDTPAPTPTPQPTDAVDPNILNAQTTPAADGLPGQPAAQETASPEPTPNASAAARDQASAGLSAANAAHDRYLDRAGSATDPERDPNYRAAEEQYQLGHKLEEQGRYDRAAFYYREAERLFNQAGPAEALPQ